MDIFTIKYAKEQDEIDPLRDFRSRFLIPTKAELSRETLLASQTVAEADDDDSCIYLCGNSLGLQPRLTRQYLQQYLDTWATKGVYGHFKSIVDSDLPPWIDVDDDVRQSMADVVGAHASEVVVMQTLTANLHLMLASFYTPNADRYKIILEGKAFPSDHYVVESQLRHHGLDPEDAMILIEPVSADSPVLSTEQILACIDRHADQAAIVLLPGIQFYSGQLFEIAKITAHAQKHGMIVGWDLAHAAGNVLLQLHDWNVDFACWCTYKYLNSGPGAIGGCFVHERHGEIAGATRSDQMPVYRTRLSGWWGSAKSSRFDMSNRFEPMRGAAGYQLSNPSVADMTAVRASLDIFRSTSMEQLREKSVKMTKYLEDLLGIINGDLINTSRQAEFRIITPKDPSHRGAQLSIMLAHGLLEPVMHILEKNGVVVDERRPDVIRVAPAPLYNNFVDVFHFARVFRHALSQARLGDTQSESVMVDVGKDQQGWATIK